MTVMVRTQARLWGHSGFTLLELMVVVAIVGVLATIAFPSYQRSVAKTWRSHAVACLEELSVGMERRYTVAMSFAGTAPPPNGCTIDGDPSWVVPDEGLANRYGFAFAADPTATTYTLLAVPTDLQAGADIDCGTLSLSQSGERDVSGTAAIARCW